LAFYSRLYQGGEIQSWIKRKSYFEKLSKTANSITNLTTSYRIRNYRRRAVTKSKIETVSSRTFSQIVEIECVTEPLYQNGKIEFNRFTVTWNFKHHAVRSESQNDVIDVY